MVYIRVLSWLILSCKRSFVKEKFGEKFVLLETDLGAVENMDYYQVSSFLEHKDLLLLNEIFKCGDMPFNFGLARNLKSGFGPEDIREEVGR